MRLLALADRPFLDAFRAHCAHGRALAHQALSDLNGIRYASPDGAFYAFLGIEGLSNFRSSPPLRFQPDHAGMQGVEAVEMAIAANPLANAMLADGTAPPMDRHLDRLGLDPARLVPAAAVPGWASALGALADPSNEWHPPR